MAPSHNDANGEDATYDIPTISWTCLLFASVLIGQLLPQKGLRLKNRMWWEERVTRGRALRLFTSIVLADWYCLSGFKASCVRRAGFIYEFGDVHGLVLEGRNGCFTVVDQLDCNEMNDETRSINQVA